jgi:hypothetical protein
MSETKDRGNVNRKTVAVESDPKDEIERGPVYLGPERRSAYTIDTARAPTS